MRIPKISVIGCGYWGKNLVRNFSELGVLHSICDASPELARKTSANYGVEAQNLNELFQSDCDGVVIAAPAAQHYDLTQQALRAGKHVFVEKPLSLKVEAKVLGDLSKKVDKKLMVRHLLQYHPAFVRLKQLNTLRVNPSMR